MFVVIGNDDKRLRPLCSARRPAAGFPLRDEEPAVSRSMVVFADVFREIIGRAALNELEAPGASGLGMGESRLIDRAEGVLGLLLAVAESAPGTGDGAGEPLAAAVALRT
jgi:hypothetical protein